MTEHVKRENVILKRECVGMDLDEFIKNRLSSWWVLENQSVNPDNAHYHFSRMGGLLSLDVYTERDYEKRKNIITKIISNH